MQENIFFALNEEFFLFVFMQVIDLNIIIFIFLEHFLSDQANFQTVEYSTNCWILDSRLHRFIEMDSSNKQHY